MAWLFGWRRGVTLTRQFGVLSLVVVGLITTTFCLVISHSLKQDLLDREWNTTADFIRTEAVHNLKTATSHSRSPGGRSDFDRVTPGDERLVWLITSRHWMRSHDWRTARGNRWLKKSLRLTS